MSIGYDYWIVIAIGAFLVNLTTTGVVIISIFIGLGNSFEAFIGAYLVNRFAAGINSFGNWHNILKFVALIAFIATAASATIGVTTLLLGGLATLTSYPNIWFTWWLGDMIGAIVFAPAIILLYKNPQFNITKNTIEKIATFIVMLLITYIVFGGIWPVYYPISYLCLIAVGWIALRYSPREVAITCIIITGIAVWGTLHGLGPFYIQNNPNAALILLQTFIGILTVSGLILSATTRGEESAKKALLNERDVLDLQVRYRTESLLETQQKLDLVLESTHIGVIDLDIKHDISIRNLKHDQIFGYKTILPNWGLKSLYRHIMQKDRKYVDARFKEAYKTGILSIRCRITWPDMSMHWIEMTGKVFYDQKHKPVRLLSTVVEISGNEHNGI